MDSEHKVAVWIVGFVVALLGVMIIGISHTNITETQLQVQVDKAAISAGLCQELNGSSQTWPLYHWTVCRKP